MPKRKAYHESASQESAPKNLGVRLEKIKQYISKITHNQVINAHEMAISCLLKYPKSQDCFIALNFRTQCGTLLSHAFRSTEEHKIHLLTQLLNKGFSTEQLFSMISTQDHFPHALVGSDASCEGVTHILDMDDVIELLGRLILSDASYGHSDHGMKTLLYEIIYADWDPIYTDKITKVLEYIDAVFHRYPLLNELPPPSRRSRQERQRCSPSHGIREVFSPHRLKSLFSRMPVVEGVVKASSLGL